MRKQSKRMMMTPRGLRNNNPLNIRKNSTKWQGLAEEQTDKSFFVFAAPEWGYRAALRTLQNYKRVHGLNTVAEWIYRWAPPRENDTENYIDVVCSRAGIARDCAPNIRNKTVMCNIVAAMSYMENGVEAVMEDIHRGWNLL